jgi:hypothetical protein
MAKTASPYVIFLSHRVGRDESGGPAVATPVPVPGGAGGYTCAERAWMPGRNFGTRRVIFVPAPTPVSMTRPWSSP